MKTVLIWGIQGYRRFLSPLFPPTCRFTPTCSQYALDAVRYHGAIRGTGLALKRILRCHPFHPGGYDPVPDVLWQVGETRIADKIKGFSTTDGDISSDTSASKQIREH